MKQAIQRADWVTCGDSPMIGVVHRLAKDGTWADVHWGSHTKRMQTCHLTVQHTISQGDGWEVTDLTRQREMEKHEAADEYCWEHNEREEDGGWFCLACREQAALDAFQAIPSYVERYAAPGGNA